MGHVHDVQCTLKAAPLRLAQLDPAVKNKSFFLLDWVQENHARFTTACNHDGSSWFIRILVKMMTSPLATAFVYSKEIADNAVFRDLPTIQSDLLPFLWRSLPLQKGAMCSICLGALTISTRWPVDVQFTKRQLPYHQSEFRIIRNMCIWGFPK